MNNVPRGEPPALQRGQQRRKRTKHGRYIAEITLAELKQYFHLPASVACDRLGIGLTMIKRISRKYGIPRWPYRRHRVMQSAPSELQPAWDCCTELGESDDAECSSSGCPVAKPSPRGAASDPPCASPLLHNASSSECQSLARSLSSFGSHDASTRAMSSLASQDLVRMERHPVPSFARGPLSASQRPPRPCSSHETASPISRASAGGRSAALTDLLASLRPPAPSSTTALDPSLASCLSAVHGLPPDLQVAALLAVERAFGQASEEALASGARRSSLGTTPRVTLAAPRVVEGPLLRVAEDAVFAARQPQIAAHRRSAFRPVARRPTWY